MPRTDSEATVLRPTIAAWEQAASRPPRKKPRPVDRSQRRADEEARRSRLRLRELIFKAERRFGVSELEIQEEPEISSKVERWLRRLQLFDTWKEVTSDTCLPVTAVPMREIIERAIGVRTPLGRWCLAFLYMSAGKGDAVRIDRQLPWLEDCEAATQECVVRHLTKYEVALLTCETEALARTLMAASARAYLIDWRLYSPAVVEGGDSLGGRTEGS